MVARKLSPAARQRQIRAELRRVVAQLRQLHSTLAVAVTALREQNADIDADIAQLLQRSVRNPLQSQIQKLVGVLRVLRVHEVANASSARKNR